jgi:hypothetical protein
MKRLLLILFLCTSLAAGPPAPLFSQINAMERGLAEITGLSFRRTVPYAVMNKDQLRRYLEQRVKETIKPADLRAEELTLKLLGLVPPDFDLRQNTVDLLTEQAAAFYDYNKKKLFMLEDPSGDADEEIALVHELAHALADQHFPLAKYISEGMRSDDGATARQAVMEGQASWLMTAYLSKKSGGPGEVSDAILDLMTHSMESSPEQYPVFSKAPDYIREMLVFPYADGMLFQNVIFHQLGRDAFSEVFRHPPVSTQQIIHPDSYLAHVLPRIPDPPRPSNPHEYRTLAEGTLGELDYRILLSQYLGKHDGPPLAAHLVGSSYQLLEQKHGRIPLLAYASTWDSSESAAKFLTEYERVLRGKWKQIEIESQTNRTEADGHPPATEKLPPAFVVRESGKGSELSGRGDSGYFRVWLDGATVNHLEGLQSRLH